MTGLAEKGNAFEAAAVAGVETAKDPDVSDVTIRQVPEEDFPEGSLNDDGRVAKQEAKHFLAWD